MCCDSIFREETKKIYFVSLKHILLQHQQRVIKASDEEDYQRISVRRSKIYHDAIRAFSKVSFDANKILKVCFIATVDEGGPHREFF